MNYIEETAERIRVTAPTSSPPGLLRAYALLVFITGAATTLENVHDAWSAWRTAAVPDDPCIIPFAELAPAMQARDQKYVTAIRAEAARLEGRR